MKNICTRDLQKQVFFFLNIYLFLLCPIIINIKGRTPVYSPNNKNISECKVFSEN